MLKLKILNNKKIFLIKLVRIKMINLKNYFKLFSFTFNNFFNFIIFFNNHHSTASK